MLWTELTPSDFIAARENSKGLCVLPVGAVERHGGHVPLGCDAFIIEDLCRRAAGREPAVIMPVLHFGVNASAAANTGAIALRTETVLGLIEDICAEIARNGFDKILLCSGHGGNRHVLPLIVQQWTTRPRDGMVYYCYAWESELELKTPRPEVARPGGHGGQLETSAVMAARQGLVKMDQRPPDETTGPFGRLDATRKLGVQSSLDWYANYPYHYAGSAEGASRELGEELAGKLAARLAGIFKAIKEDAAGPELLAEFNARREAGGTLEPPKSS